MATDGVSLYYNHDFVETLNAATLAGTLAHEVMHPALHHHVRRSGRDPKRWNVACDFAINPLLVDAGLNLPEGILLDNRFRGMSAEQIYNLLESEAGEDPGRENEEGEPGGKNRTLTSRPQATANEPSAPRTEGGIGQVLDAPRPDEDSPTIEEQDPGVEYSGQPSDDDCQACGKDSGRTQPDFGRSGRGRGRLARIPAAALVGDYPGGL